MVGSKEKVCGDCEKRLTPECPRYEYKDYETNLAACLPTDAACPKFKKKKERRTKPSHKASGLAVEGYFEAIYHNNLPAFLVAAPSGLQIMESVTNFGKTIQPLEHGEFPYIPYNFTPMQLGTAEDLFWRVRNEFHFFVDVEGVWKDYFASCTLMSYQQEKLHTIPYIWIYGDNDAGKSVILDLFNHLAFRPLYGACLNVADLYGYLGDMGESGVILEDEAQGLSSRKELDKQKIYKIGYKRGAKVPRYRDINGKSRLVYYPAFCFKAVASEKLPKSKGLLERFVPVQMTTGYPEKDWADLDVGDIQRFCETRNLLLKWRLLTMTSSLPNVELPVRGRVKELWKPVFQVVEGLTIQPKLYKFLDDLYIKRLDDLRNTLEGNIIKVVGGLVTQVEQPIPFQRIWDELLLEMNGTIDDKNPNKMMTPEFDLVTKSKVGYRLREVLDGKKTVQRFKVGDESILSKCYFFDTNKLRRILRKYGFKQLVTELRSLPSFGGVQAPNSTLKNDVEKPVCAPLKHGKPSNSVTTCWICHRLLPADLKNCTTEQGKTCHLECWKKWKAGRKGDVFGQKR
jgi:hypothetical protein